MSTAPERIVLVTGAGRGIGEATALRFAKQGAAVALLARSDPDLQRVASDVRRCGGEPLILPADVADDDQVAAAFKQLSARWGGLDFLINAAGMAHLGPIVQMPVEAYDKLMAVNARGVFLTCRAAWPLLLKRGGGVIVNVSSMAASDPFTGFAVYGGSKAFVETFTKAVADEGESVNIRAFGIAPGAVATRMLFDVFPDFPRTDALAPDDVAALIESVCVDETDAESGQTITISK